MGGHGGLNILPQKSWNVYNIKNQNIVRRDEERFRKEQAEAERQAQREQSEARLTKLREQNPDAIQRFNLFEDEEKNANTYEKTRRQAEIDKKEKDKDTWFLGKMKPKSYWYELPTKMDDKGPEIRRRSEVDPMSLVNSVLSKQESSPCRQQEFLNNSHHKVKSSKKGQRSHIKEVDDQSDEAGEEKRRKRHRSERKDKNKRKRHRSPSSKKSKHKNRKKNW